MTEGICFICSLVCTSSSSIRWGAWGPPLLGKWTQPKGKVPGIRGSKGRMRVRARAMGWEPADQAYPVRLWKGAGSREPGLLWQKKPFQGLQGACGVTGYSDSHWTVIKHLPARRQKGEGEVSICPSWHHSFLPNYFEISLFKILNIPGSILIQLSCVEFKIPLTFWDVFLEDKSLGMLISKLWPPEILLQYISHNLVRVQALGSSLSAYLLAWGTSAVCALIWNECVVGC